MTSKLRLVVVALAFASAACNGTPTSPSMVTEVSNSVATAPVGAKSSVNVATASSTITVPADAVATGTTPSDTPTAPVEPTVQAPTTPVEGTPKWALAVKFVNAATNMPLGGVSVVITDGPNAGSSATSDPNGMATFPQLWNSGFTLAVRAGANNAGFTRAVTLTSDTSIEVAIDTLWALSGRVLKEHGAPLAGATVSVVDGPNAGRSATSGADGSYSISGLRWGGFTARATKSGFNVVSAGVHLRMDTAQDFVGLNEQAPPTTTTPGTGTPGGNTPGGTTTGGGPDGTYSGSLVSLTVSGGVVVSLSMSGCHGGINANFRGGTPLGLNDSAAFSMGGGRTTHVSWSISNGQASGEVQYTGGGPCSTGRGSISWSASR